MKWLTVLPSIHRRRTQVCLDSMATEFADSVLLIDNTKENRGVAASWNIGVDLVIAEQYDWLIVLSAGIRFGQRGGMDFLHELLMAESLVVEADNDLGWHLIAFSREALERVGPFDAILFHPAYCEDLDWSERYQRAYGLDSHAPDFEGPLWPKVPCDAVLREVAHGLKRGGVVVDLEEMRRRYHAKWGPDGTYPTPYDDPTLDWTYCGFAPLRSVP